MPSSQWVYTYNKTPKSNYGKVKSKPIIGNGDKNIRVDSLYTDKKLGIKKKKK